jgi:outer membrane receptor protein involved in Fe transport
MRQLILIAALSVSLQAVELGGSPGWVGRLGGGTREFTLGNAVGACEPAALDAWWNPANLPLRNGWDLSMSAEQRPLDRQGGAIGAATNIGSRIGVGAVMLYRRDANVPIYDEDEALTGKSAPYFLQTQIGLGLRITRQISLGASFGVYSEDLDLDGVTTYRAPARIDLAGIYRGPDTLWAVSVLVRNIGLTSDLIAREDRNGTSSDGVSSSNSGIVPRTVEISGRYRYHPVQSQFVDILLTPVYQMPGTAFLDSEDAQLGWRAGLDWHPNASWALRAGYEQGSWGFGGGMRILPWQDDTAYTRQSLWLDYGAMIERETGASLMSVGLRGSL